MNDKIRPQDGPQTQFLASSADIAIYGGAAGGGKTWALLVEPLRHISNPNFGATIFRRNAVQITNQGGLWAEATKMYPLLGAESRQSPNLDWTFESGANIKFAHLEADKTVYNYQGAQIPLICCEETEHVRMADGSLKMVKDLQIGDTVATLQGGKKVTAVGLRRLEDCVYCAKSDGTGQVQSFTHSVLTTSGWISYADVLHQHATSLPTGYCDVDKSALQTLQQCQAPQQLHGNHSQGSLQVDGCVQPLRHRQSSQDICVCKVRQGRHSCNESLPHEHQALLPPLSGRHFQAPSERFPDLLVGGISHVSFSDAAPCAATALKDADFECHCSICFHQDDELAHSLQDNDLVSVPLLGGVVAQSQMGSLLDAQGITHTNTRHNLQYAHPYMGALQTAEVPVVFDSFSLTPIGKRWVIDITVSDTNHYITGCGIVNKNCYDELTHFSDYQFFYMLSRNRSTCGVKPYIRATTNPDADSWVAEFIAWWIDQDTGFAIPERSGIIRWFVRVNDTTFWGDTAQELIDKYGSEATPKSVTFVASSIYDNKILLEADPGYLANLNALSVVERERLKNGNWKIRPASGLYFRREWVTMLDALPADLIALRDWDLAATEKTPTNDPDFTASVKMAKDREGHTYICHAMQDRISPFKVRRAIKNYAEQDGRKVSIGLSQDPGQAGKEQAQSLVRELAGYKTIVERETGDKITRFEPFSAQCEAGNVYVLRGAWNDMLFDHLEAFPEAAHDDLADCCSGAYNKLSNKRTPMRISDEVYNNVRH